jgi:predicted O-methyltransferase YrrM
VTGRAPSIWKLLPLAFIPGAAAMALEILAGRILAPYFGSNAQTWGQLIAVFLLFMSLGYDLGGRLAEAGRASWVAFGLFGSALWVLALPYFAPPVCEGAIRVHPESVLLAATILFGPPVFWLTAPYPIVLKTGASLRTGLGVLAGRLGAVGTLGSLAGTLAATFGVSTWAGLGTRRCLVLLALAILACGLELRRLGKPRSGRAALATGALGGLAFASLAWGTWFSPPRPEGPGTRLLVDLETPYHHLRVVEEEDGEKLRHLRFAGELGSQSSVASSPGLPVRGLFPEFFLLSYAYREDLGRVAMAGAGGGLTARLILEASPAERYPDLRIDVIDIDPAVFELAHEYFGYPRPGDEPRLRSHVMDARRFFRESRDTYDLVILDAFTSKYRVPEHLLTLESFALVGRRLAPGGVLAINAMVALEGVSAESARFHSLLKTLRQAFPGAAISVFPRERLRSDWEAIRRDGLGITFLVATQGKAARLDARRLVRRFPRRPLAMQLSTEWPIRFSPEELAAYEAAPAATDDFNPLNRM